MRHILFMVLGLSFTALAFADYDDVEKQLYKGEGRTPSYYNRPLSHTPEVKAADNWLRKKCEGFDQVDAQNKFLPGKAHDDLYRLHKRALAKSATAQAQLGDMYIDGTHVPQDWLTGLCWYRAAAQNGSAYAEYWLGIFYQNGWVVAESAKVAAHWFTLAGRHRDSVAAESKVGARYADDDSGVHDMGKALVWYHRAADKRDLNAELALGDFYITSHEASDIKLALTWYGKASAQHSVEADYNIGQIYLRGVGIPQDLGQAHKWLLSAAQRGYEPAQFDLAEMYYRGEGVKQDWIKSYAWLEVSNATEYNPAARSLDDMLITHFSPRELTLASNLASEYKARYTR